MAAETDTKTLKFKIEGVEYDVPPISDLDMDEWEVIYQRTGLVMDDFSSLTPVVAVMSGEVARLAAEALDLEEGTDERREADEKLADAKSVLADAEAEVSDELRQAERDRQRSLAQPGFTRALVQIAYQRAHPDEKKAVVERFASKAKLVPITVGLLEQSLAEETPVPLAQTPEPAPSSPARTGDENAKSSTDSTPNSDAPAGLHAPTGAAV